MEHYYIKVGRRYQKAMPYYGFPADGVWVVKGDGKSATLVLKIGEYTVEDAQLLVKKTLLRHEIKEAATRVLLQDLNGKSVNDIAELVADELIGG